MAASRSHEGSDAGSERLSPAEPLAASKEPPVDTTNSSPEMKVTKVEISGDGIDGSNNDNNVKPGRLDVTGHVSDTGDNSGEEKRGDASGNTTDESITDSHVDVTEAAAQRAENMALDKASESGDASAFAVAVTSGDDADGEVDGKHGGSLTSRGSEAPGEIQGTESKPELKSKSPLTEQASELSAKDTSQAVTASFQKRDSDDMEASEQGKPDAKNSAWSGPKELPRSKLSDYLENHVKRCVECSLP